MDTNKYLATRLSDDDKKLDQKYLLLCLIIILRKITINFCELPSKFKCLMDIRVIFRNRRY